jgi:hemerythrin
MALIDWNDRLSVGVEEIDKQHKKLVDMINDLADAMKDGKGKDILGPILNGLVEYTVVHFKFEEDLFDKYGYEEKEAHKIEHEKFVDKISEFNESFKSGNSFITISLMNFLSDWLQNHIKVTDKKYSSFFNANGLN